MAWITIWQNPGDAGDKIEYDSTSNMYRFTADTSYLISFLRNGLGGSADITISGGTFNSSVALTNNGIITATKDLTLQAHDNAVLRFGLVGGSKTFTILDSNGAERVKVQNDGVVIKDAIRVNSPSGSEYFRIIATSSSIQMWRTVSGVNLLMMEIVHSSGEMVLSNVFPAGLRIPPVSTDPMGAPTNGGAGSARFNTTNNKLWIYNGSAWKSVQLA